MAGLKSDIPRQSVRRIRRRQNKKAASAELLLDRRLEDDCVVLSDDVYQELFSSQEDLNGSGDTQSDAARYVAITHDSHLDLDRLDTVQWILKEARAHSAGYGTKLPHRDSTVWRSYDREAVTHLVQGQPATGLTRAGEASSGVAIRILETVPCVLDAIYIDVECLPDQGVSLDNVMNEAVLINPGDNESIMARAGETQTVTEADGALDPQPSVPDASSATKSTDTARFKDVLRRRFKEYLRPPKVLRSGDIYTLSFSAAVKTEICARVALCDPVAQGVVDDTTLLVLRLQQDSANGATSISNPAAQDSNWRARRTVTGKCMRELSPASRMNLGTNGANAGRDSKHGLDPGSGYDGSDYISSLDDSDEDMISLDLPPISASISGLGGTPMLDAGQLGKPKLQPHQLPAASASSTPSTSSGRRGGRPSEIFKVLELRQPIANTLLHPLPARDDDPEARLYVSARALIRLHCFSGDWVTLEPTMALASEQSSSGRIDDGREPQGVPGWRIARIYAIPEGYASPSANQPDEGINVSDATTRSSRTQPWQAYVPGILLINLKYPNHLHVTPLEPRPPNDANHLGPQKVPSPSACLGSPPSAKEVTLLKLSTPFSGEWASQPLLLLSLKKYFSKKRRLVRCGDLIGVHVDTGISRLAYQARIPAEKRPEVMELLKASLAAANDDGRVDDRFREYVDVAWFEIGGVTVESTHHQEGTYTEDWGGIVTVDPLITRILQTGNLQGRLPRKPQAATTSFDGSDLVDSASGLSKESMGSAPADSTVSPKQRLKELVAAAVNPMAMTLHLEPLALLLHSQQRGVGKTMTARRVCSELGLHLFVINAVEIASASGAGGGNVQSEVLLKTRLERALSCGPAHCAILVEHVEALAADRVLAALSDFVSNTRVFIATTTDVDNVPSGLRAVFSHELEVPVPDERGRRELLQDIIKDKDVPVACDVDISAVTTKTAALAAGDLVDVVDRAMAARALRVASLCDRLNRHRPRGAQITIHDLHLAGGDAVRCITGSDLDEAVDAARKNFSDSIGTPKIPTVKWEDVGGLTHVKEAVVETIQLPLEHPELFVKGMKKRSGILFYGPPGTGKTLLAKAIATEFSLNFFSVKGPELLNMYVGESEANVRRVFQRARDARPCVVFFDELDSVAPKRGNQGDSGGVMDRIVSQLLAELDGMSDGQASVAGGVFVVGATNRPDLLDPALLRPGRFDKMLYLGISDTHEKQLKILQALTRKFDLDPALSLGRIAEGLPYTYSGADIYALCSDAMLKAIARKVSALEAKVGSMAGSSRTDDEPVSVSYYLDHMATEDDTAVVVAEEDFVAAQRDLVGSVSAKELEHYDRIRRAFEPDVNTSKAPSSS